MSGEFLHKDLAGGRWHQMTLSEQLGNIGSEVSRANLAEGKDKKRFDGAVDRALELFDLTISDSRWRGRLREIGRAREVFCDAVYGGKEYGSSFKNLQNYFDHFALVANNN